MGFQPEFDTGVAKADFVSLESHGRPASGVVDKDLLGLLCYFLREGSRNTWQGNFY